MLLGPGESPPWPVAQSSTAAWPASPAASHGSAEGPRRGAWARLTSMLLSSNAFTHVPDTVGRLTALTCLDLSHNDLTEVCPVLEPLRFLKELQLKGRRCAPATPRRRGASRALPLFCGH